MPKPARPLRTAVSNASRLLAVPFALPIIFAIVSTPLVTGQGVDVPKTNPLPVYMHYMPWFETPESNPVRPGNWGYHWTLNSENPDTFDTQGRRNIASHYDPLIGPYASSDPKVIEYHLLLMKLSGVDGVIIDWYGTNGTNGDINALLTNSNALIDRVDDFGLDFAVMLEDRFAASTGDPVANVDYAQANYFNQSNYIRLGEGDPLLPVFGPITQESPAQWNTILAGHDADLLALPYQSDEMGAEADGEFQWISENDALDNHLEVHEDFLLNRAATLGTAIASAYPGFDSFYAEAGINNGVTLDIPHSDVNGGTLEQVLAQVATHTGNIDALQLATFNDFGEGTIFEPTAQTGYRYLEEVQRFTGTDLTATELDLVYRLFLGRRDLGDDPQAQLRLDAAAEALNNLQFGLAQLRINQANGIPEPGVAAWLIGGLLPVLGRRRRR